jgi:hypothetical protein
LRRRYVGLAAAWAISGWRLSVRRAVILRSRRPFLASWQHPIAAMIGERLATVELGRAAATGDHGRMRPGIGE